MWNDPGSAAHQQELLRRAREKSKCSGGSLR